LLKDDEYYEAVSSFLDKAEETLKRADATPSYAVDAASLAPRGGNHVMDETGTLTGAQIEALNVKAAAFTEKHECAVYIWIVDLVPEENAKTIDDVEAYIDVFYMKYDLGYGDNKNGIVLLLEIGDVPGERDYLFYTYGPCANFFSNDTRETILDEYVVPLFRAAFDNGNFYRVADTFLRKIENEYLMTFVLELVVKLLFVILPPMIIAFVVCSVWKARMKTAKIAHTADNYIPKGGFHLTGRQDQFLYRSTTRTMIEGSSSSSGGSSSSSSGRSSGGKV
jgi:uncharacterized protein